MSSAFWRKGLVLILPGEETTQQEGNTLDCISEVSALYFTALALAFSLSILHPQASCRSSSLFQGRQMANPY